MKAVFKPANDPLPTNPDKKVVNHIPLTTVCDPDNLISHIHLRRSTKDVVVVEIEFTTRGKRASAALSFESPGSIVDGTDYIVHIETWHDVDGVNTYAHNSVSECPVHRSRVDFCFGSLADWRCIYEPGKWGVVIIWYRLGTNRRFLYLAEPIPETEQENKS